MKKTLLAFTLASMFMASAVQAVDHSATVNISGTVIGNADSECSVHVATPSVTLSGQIDHLPTQGQVATTPVPLDYSISEGASSTTGGCLGKVELQFHGVVDDADGTVLANSDTGAGSAQGVGVGLFDKYQNPININDNTVQPDQAIDVVYLQMVKLNGKTPVEGTVHASMTIDIVRL
ncbi:fimbrial protein [Lelliottia amnigena]|jgi:major type 1 subunit fimbrin (pilin)